MFNRIKNWLEKNNGKYVIANEQGQPLYVIMQAEEYDRLLENKSNNPSNLTREELIERINQDIDIWKSSQAQEITEPAIVDTELEENNQELIIEEMDQDLFSEELAKKLANF